MFQMSGFRNIQLQPPYVCMCIHVGFYANWKNSIGYWLDCPHDQPQPQCMFSLSFYLTIHFRNRLTTSSQVFISHGQKIGLKVTCSK